METQGPERPPAPSCAKIFELHVYAQYALLLPVPYKSRGYFISKAN
jgi:hypothetical protein